MRRDFLKQTDSYGQDADLYTGRRFENQFYEIYDQLGTWCFLVESGVCRRGVFSWRCGVSLSAYLVGAIKAGIVWRNLFFTDKGRREKAYENSNDDK